MTVSTRQLRHVAMFVAYDGTDYVGWQDQGANLPSIQSTLSNAASQFFGTNIAVQGSSRTDAGVHARAQLASFKFAHPIELNGLEKVINRHLPKSISVRDSRLVSSDFFPRHAVIEKTYRYQLYTSRITDPLIDRFSARTHYRLDVERMKEASRSLLGTHDFKSLAASDYQSTSTIRTIHSIEIRQTSSGLLIVDVRGAGFLKQMVRNIIGSLIEIGREHRPIDWLEDVLAAKDRQAAGPTAPARGLTLWDSKVIWPRA